MVKFNNLGLTIGTNLKFYTKINLKVRKFCGLIPMFVEVIEEKLAGGPFASPPPILNRVKIATLAFNQLKIPDYMNTCQ